MRRIKVSSLSAFAAGVAAASIESGFTSWATPVDVHVPQVTVAIREAQITAAVPSFSLARNMVFKTSRVRVRTVAEITPSATAFPPARVIAALAEEITNDAGNAAR